jgi:uncharacterized protein YqgC (DUF456 family)
VGIDWSNELTWLVGVAVVVGLAGVVVQLLPGALLVGGAVLAWGLIEGGPVGWTVAAVALIVTAATQAVKYLVAGRYLHRGGVPGSTMVWGSLAGVVGFFVVPVVGLVLGFVLGVYVAERVRLKANAAAWASTWRATKASGITIVIELAGTLLVAVAWVAALLLR